MIVQNVCSLELSMRLKELGVKQESLFRWEYFSPEIFTVKFTPFAIVSGDCQIFAAFTSGELAELLPKNLSYDDNNLILSSWHFNGLCSCAYQLAHEGEFYTPLKVFDDSTEANARAKMFIYLLENGFIKNAQ